MDAQLEEFKAFVKKHPGLREEVRTKRLSWQAIYEEWYLYGESDSQWEKYKQLSESQNEKVEESVKTESTTSVSNSTETSSATNTATGTEMLTQAFQYLQKMDMNKVSQTMGTVSQFVKLFQSFSGGAGAGASTAASAITSATARDTYPGLFSKFDD